MICKNCLPSWVRCLAITGNLLVKETSSSSPTSSLPAWTLKVADFGDTFDCRAFMLNVASQYTGTEEEVACAYVCAVAGGRLKRRARLWNAFQTPPAIAEMNSASLGSLRYPRAVAAAVV